MVNGWNTLSASDWSYTASNSCGNERQSGSLAKITTSETARDAMALGSEATEQSTFDGYTPLLYADLQPGSLGTVTSGGTTTQSNCQLSFGISLRGSALANITTPAQDSTVRTFGDLCQTTRRSNNNRRVDVERQDIR